MKQTVCVIFGGKSSEHEVSCRSAANVLSYIDREKCINKYVSLFELKDAFVIFNHCAKTYRQSYNNRTN